MADTKISALTPVAAIAGSEVFPLVKAGTTQSASISQVKTYMGVSGVNTGDQDLSGLVTKVTTVNGHALSTNVTVTASDVGLGNVDNTSDANKPVSTATATALSGKQDTLVSGTNIKTIGGVSVLGSGDIPVGGTGTVTSVAVATANGLAGSVANSTTTPNITLSTTVTGVLKGDGTAISAAVANTDYQSPIGTISGIAKGNGANALTAATAGTDYTSPSSTETMTNKRITARVGSTTSSATPTINTDNVDIYKLTAQAVDITNMSTNLSGTPTDGQVLIIEITGTAARAITWGTSFEASTVALPTTTVTTAMLAVAFLWNTATSKWRCVAAV